MPTYPPKTLSCRRFFALTALLASVGLFAAGCSDPAAPADDGVAETNIYTTRGLIMELPAADNPAAGLRIKHEAIPDFVNQAGDIEPMNTMTMGFPVGDGVDLAGLAVGDKVAVTFEVIWGVKRSGWEATAIEKLPADTELKLSGTAETHHDAAHGDHAGHHH